MTIGLAVWITAAVSVAGAAGAYLYSVRHTDRLMSMARDGALAQSQLIRGALEHAMLEDDRVLIEKMITTFGREREVVNVMLLDREGTVQFSAGPLAPGDELDLQSPTCQACHRYPAAERMSSRVLDTRGGAILRTVVPLRNEPRCHECHDPADAINGVLIADVDAGAIMAASNRDLGWLVAVSGALTLLLVSAIALGIRQVIVRRLQRFEVAARQIAQGDLTRRVPDGGSDIISWLGREFNVMAESVSSLIGQVRSERERLETVIDSIDDGIVVLDAHRNVVAANQAFIRRSGVVREQLLGCSCKRDGAGACAVTDCPTLSCLQSGTRQVRICERRKPDGSSAWEEVHASPIAGLPGDPIHVVEVWRDISDRRTAEARLAESHRLASLGLLASGFSHEMNTPLGTVLACVEGIVREAQGSEASVDRDYIRDHATTAREQVMRCRGITEQFLRMSRGQQSPAQIVRIGDAVAAAVRLVQPTARARGVAIEHVGVIPDLRVRAEGSELQHALINLLLNALQACGAGGIVRVEALRGGADGAQAVIRITDNGCGIAPEHRAHIFEPFFSVRAEGTGLGLFLSLNFVRRSGGDILVDSAPGKGSTFSIVLPVIGGSAIRMDLREELRA
ncbi:MAG TPA: ATP-binding protein [Vicinamibacterales bacterium]|nr:ATP-binding protein [Vicinamibacterales bacterium]